MFQGLPRKTYFRAQRLTNIHLSKIAKFNPYSNCCSLLTSVTFFGTRKLLMETFFKKSRQSFLSGSVVKNLPANTEDTGSIPDPERSHMPRSNKAHAPQLLSQCSRAWEQQPLKLGRPRAKLHKKNTLRKESFPRSSVGKELACNAGDRSSIPGSEMATHPSILAWRIPWTEEPGKL